MSKFPPKYTEFQLQSILETDPQLPGNINEHIFEAEIKNNTRIKWRVNHFVFKRKLLPFLVDTKTLKKWRIFKSLNWILVLLIVGLTIWTSDYRIFFFLIVYALLIIPVDHWIFIFNMSTIIVIKLLFKLNIAFFWYFIIVALIGYLLNKAIEEMIEKKIVNLALNNLPAFWKYYSNKIIWIDEFTLNDEYKRLTDKYSELRT